MSVEQTERTEKNETHAEEPDAREDQGVPPPPPKELVDPDVVREQLEHFLIQREAQRRHSNHSR